LSITAENVANTLDTGELPRWSSLCVCKAHAQVAELGPRIALLTPYNGGNFGDAALQDSMIANLRLRLPGAEFAGICLNLENFIARHGVSAFPLCGVDILFYHMLYGTIDDGDEAAGKSSETRRDVVGVKRALKRLPVLGRTLLAIRACWRELRHWLRGYRFLRTQDLVIVSGGGQLNEEWGSAWGQPFALFKWAILARAARIPYVMASVGVGKVTSTTARVFILTALRMARYRSYRDKNSRAFAMGLLQQAAKDPLVPDLAFSLPRAEMPDSLNRQVRTEDRRIIAISPIAFAKPGRWPSEDRNLYERYIRELARVVPLLLDRKYSLVIVCSSLWDDESAIGDLCAHFDGRSRDQFGQQIHIPAVKSWRDFVASTRGVDCLIVSRLHSAILGFISDKPIVAISFDPKVDWVMEDLGQTDYLLTIQNFVAEDVIEALDRMAVGRGLVEDRIRSYRHRTHRESAQQYDELAKLAVASRWRRSIIE
jgi:polysaccharide pyruvyl transferase WcaK-like protein